MRKNNQVNIVLILSLTFSIFIIVLLSIFGLKNIMKVICNFNFTAITSIVSVIALISTIIYNRKLQNKNIEASIRSTNQLEFEKELYNILDTYNKLLIDMCLLKLDFDNSNKNLIMRECISSWNDCTTRYQYLLDDMEHKIYYFYKYYNAFNHDELDKLIKDIQGLNQSIKLELIDYSKLSMKAHKINEKFTKLDKILDSNERQNEINSIFTECEEIIKDSNSIVTIISNLILSKKNIIYTGALNSIKEREKLIKIYNEENDKWK